MRRLALRIVRTKCAAHGGIGADIAPRTWDGTWVVALASGRTGARIGDVRTDAGCWGANCAFECEAQFASIRSAPIVEAGVVTGAFADCSASGAGARKTRFWCRIGGPIAAGVITGGSIERVAALVE